MPSTVKTGLIEKLTNKALEGKSVSMSDVVEIAKLIDINARAASNAINRLDSRINELTEPKTVNDANFEIEVTLFMSLPTIIKAPVH